MKIIRKIASFALLLAIWAPQSALACSVCFSAREETRAAFYQTTALLTFLPLLMMAAFIMWVRKRMKNACAPQGDEPARP